MAESNLSPQFGNELGGVDWTEYRKPKEPHQMTPDEFAAHPYAVFHGTDVPEEKFNSWLDKGKKEFFGNPFHRHYGTEQASVQALAPNLLTYKYKPDSQKNPRIYTYWHRPKPSQIYSNKLDVGSDEAANLSSNMDSYDAQETYGKHYEEDYVGEDQLLKDKSLYYENKFEDKGSTSLASLDPNNIKSQGDYVAEAIRKGKAHEIHPMLLRLGRVQLDSPKEVTKDMAKKYASVKQLKVLGKTERTNFGWQPQLSGLEEPQLSGLEDKKGGAYTKPERISDYGPDVEKTGTEYVRRQQVK